MTALHHLSTPVPLLPLPGSYATRTHIYILKSSDVHTISLFHQHKHLQSTPTTPLPILLLAPALQPENKIQEPGRGLRQLGARSNDHKSVPQFPPNAPKSHDMPAAANASCRLAQELSQRARS